MDNRVRLKVFGISYNQLQSGAFALLLSEVDGPYRIPVVVGAAEAQSIAISLEGIKTPRPLTHDLFVSFAQGFGVRLLEVFIYKFEDGIFTSELTFSDGERQMVLDSRTSDAIAIALRCKAPIWTTREIIEKTGFIINEDSQSKEQPDQSGEIISSEPRPEQLAVEELEKLLAQLIEDENYEEAAQISKIINEKRNNNQTK